MPDNAAAEWLLELFEFELCHECGGDAPDHDAIPLNFGDYGGPYFFAKCRQENLMDESLPVAVVDEESAPNPGDIHTVVARFETADQAGQWLGQHSDQEKVRRGGFGIDAPEL